MNGMINKNAGESFVFFQKYSFNYPLSFSFHRKDLSQRRDHSNHGYNRSLNQSFRRCTIPRIRISFDFETQEEKQENISKTLNYSKKIVKKDIAGGQKPHLSKTPEALAKRTFM